LWWEALMRIVFMGTPAFAAASLRALCDAGLDVVGVVSQPARPAGRGRALIQPATALLAEERSLPLMQPEKPHAPDALATLRAWAPDVIVVAAYGHILRPAILDLPRAGCVNVHASLLPAYRGASPIPVALLAGDKETGVTIMLLDQGADTGPLLAQRAIPILDSDTTGVLTTKLADLGAHLLVETLPAWVAGQITPQPQDERRASSCPRLRKEDGVVDWSLPARQIWLRVRAFDPWPGTTTTWRGQPLKILELTPAGQSVVGPAGQVTALGEWPAVIAGDGQLLLLRRVQLAGKKPALGADFARGQRELFGAILGADI
jgi:methionyl-tRNA formyltransferase